MVNLFAGEWSSAFPAPMNGLQAGPIPLFEDSRIAWMIQQLNGIKGFRVLELGPLEGGHSYMLDRAGVASVFSIEANRRAFLKCLLAKELLGMPSVHFALGDFRAYFEQPGERWDLCVASGVLYHMHDPVDLLQKIASRASRLFLWTHYYEETILRANPNLTFRFGKSVEKRTGNLAYRLYRYNYLEALNHKGFCGGSAQFSYWLTRETILEALRQFGFQKISIGHEVPDHPHGPSFAVLAMR